MDHFTPTKRQLQALETKQKIFDASVKLFKQKGYNDTTIREITKEAGVATGSFFTYFQSKESILVMDIEHMETQLIEYIKTIENQSAREKMLKYIEYVLNWYQQKFGLEYYGGILSYYIRRIFNKTDLDIHSPKWKYRDFIRYFIEEGQENGEFRSDLDKEELYKTVEIFLHGIMLNWAIYLDSYALNEVGMKYFNLVIDNILAKKNEGCITSKE